MTCSTSPVKKEIDVNEIHHSSSSLHWNFGKICQLSTNKLLFLHITEKKYLQDHQAIKNILFPRQERT